MGIVFEMCTCTGQQKIIPNSKSVIENEVDNKYDDSPPGVNANYPEEKNKKKINNVAINNEQNNEADTYNNISSNAAFKYKKENSKIKIKTEDKDKVSRKGSINKKSKDKEKDKEKEKDKDKEKDKKKKKKKPKVNETQNIKVENDINSKKNINSNINSNTNNNNNIINNNEEEYKEISISDTILSEIVLNEKPKTIPKEKKKKIKGRNNINIVILGYNEVGKSAFCIRFVENKYEDFYIPSIGIENYSKIIAFNERNYKLNFSVIWGDINSQKQENILSSSDFFFLIYDITKIRSFNQINIYLKQLKKYLFLYDKEGKSPNFCLIGNKCDLERDRKVELEIVNKCVEKYGIKHFDISVMTAKNMNNLIQFFVSIFDKIANSEK